MKKLLVLSICSFLLLGCSKYDEGPGLSLRSKKGRITGKWNLTEVNGVNPNYYFGFSLDYYDLYMLKDGTYYRSILASSVPILQVWDGTWEFSSDKLSFTANGTVESSANYDIVPFSIEYEIIRLTNSELKITSLSSGNTHTYTKETN
tara:strand:- start:365 stop:808 length:444 start_codon:yes stop_codon:yes gene_type:complete